VTAHNASVTCTTSFTNFASSAPVVVSTTAPVFARAYVHGDYLDEVLAIIPSTGQVSGRKFAHGNHLYSLAALTDNAGAVVERYRYDGNGQRTVLAADGVTIRAASAHGNQRGFTGRYLDKETGLWCFRARQYSGSLGRFISRDPTEYVDGMSLYAAYFIPNALDPTGLETSSVQIPGDNAFWLKATYLSLRTAKAEWKKDCATATPTIESIELSSDQKPSIPERTTPLPNGANMRRHEGHYRSGKLIPNGQGDEGTATVTITGKFEACWTGKEWGKRAKWSIRGKQKYVMSIVEWEDWDERDPETGEWKHNPGFGTARETQHTFKGGTGDEGLGNLDCPCICNSVGKGGSHSREKTW
jgi:RHS repeat-associated protein